MGEFGIQKDKNRVSKGEKILCLFPAPSLLPLFVLLLYFLSFIAHFMAGRNLCLPFYCPSSLLESSLHEGRGIIQLTTASQIPRVPPGTLGVLDAYLPHE